MFLLNIIQIPALSTEDNSTLSTILFVILCLSLSDVHHESDTGFNFEKLLLCSQRHNFFVCKKPLCVQLAANNKRSC